MESSYRHAFTDRNRLSVEVFLYLQLLDLLTTLIGLRAGALEASPFVRMLMSAGPAFGVSLSKVAALLLGAACIYFRKQRLLRWISYWYAALVVWNMAVILGLGRGA